MKAVCGGLETPGYFLRRQPKADEDIGKGSYDLRAHSRILNRERSCQELRIPDLSSTTVWERKPIRRGWNEVFKVAHITNYCCRFIDL